MRHTLTLLHWAVKLHVMKWSRYREDVIVWIISIWLTLGMQACFVYVTYQSVDGNLFGYSIEQLFGFFGIAILATGLAQCVVQGIIIHLAKVVWSGQFDYWLVQPVPLLVRMLLEDIGLIWFWPHLLIGTGLILWFFPAHVWFIAFIAVLLAATFEMGLILCLCVPAIRWGRWDPSEGIWEYIEGTRSVPLGRSKSFLLLLASFGVLQYSIALDVVTGTLPLWLLAALALAVCVLAWAMLKRLVSDYASASS